MSDTLPLINVAQRDEFRNRSVADNGGNSTGSRGTVSPRSSSTIELPVEAIGVEPGVTHSYFCCVAERKYMYITITVFVLTALVYLSKQGVTMYMSSLLNWVKSIGIWGNFMFILMFLLISFPIILAGYIPLTLGAGAIYGVGVGTLTVSIASTFGACVSFWICRVSARGWLEPRLRETNEFRFFFYLFQSKKYKMVSVLARLAPIPFGLQNSFFALTDISFKEYFLSTWIGLLPFQVVWTHLGTTLRNLQKISSGEFELDFWQKMSLFIQLVVAILLLLYFVILSRRMQDITAVTGRDGEDSEMDTNNNNNGKTSVDLSNTGGSMSSSSNNNSNSSSSGISPAIRRGGDIEMGFSPSSSTSAV